MKINFKQFSGFQIQQDFSAHQAKPIQSHISSINLVFLSLIPILFQTFPRNENTSVITSEQGHFKNFTQSGHFLLASPNCFVQLQNYFSWTRPSLTSSSTLVQNILSLELPGQVIVTSKTYHRRLGRTDNIEAALRLSASSITHKGQLKQNKITMSYYQSST